MEQQQQNEQDLSFSLNGKDYKYSDCTDEQKQIVQQLNDLQGQLTELDFKFNQLSAAKVHFTDMLSEKLKEDSSKKEEKSEEAKAES